MAFGYTKYMGLITITSGVNDKIGWVETSVGGGPYGLSETIPAGDYWLDDDGGSDLFATIIALMDAKSNAAGVGLDYAGFGANYSFAVDDETGIVTVTGIHNPSGGTFLWYPYYNDISTDQIWTGGSQTIGEHDPNHIGWNVISVAAVWGTSFISAIAHANSWYPDQPIQQGTKPGWESLVVEAVSGGGNVQTYDFSGNPRDTDGNSYLDVWRPNYTRLLDAHRLWWFAEFYPYAKQGLPSGRFRYYEDRDVADFEILGLTKDRLREAQFARTVAGNPIWTIGFDMRRYKA